MKRLLTWRTRPQLWLLFSVFFCVFTLVTAAPSSVVQAQAMRSLKESLVGQKSEDGRDQKTPKRAQFKSQSGVGFALDTSREAVLIRFDGEDEIFVLNPVMGPKGDIIFKNDVGEPVLKATRWGGFTLFSQNTPVGEAAAVIGPIESFTPGEISPRMLINHLARLSYRATQVAEQKLKTRHRIYYEAQIDAEVDRLGDEYLFADAAHVTTEAIVTVASHERGAEVLNAIKRVHLSEGRPPSVKLIDGVLTLKLDTSRGVWGGRPSSKRISQVLMQSLNARR